MAQIKINNLYKQYTPTSPWAVNNLSLEIADGEFLVLLGPSGCGKTTTLRCIAGLERQTQGDIFIGDRLVNSLRPGDRDIAFVFQFYALYPHLSAYDNIAFPLRAQNLKSDEIDQQVRQVANLLRIENILKRQPRSLPSGEQQRIALGRAIVRRPQVFLMDEPLTNLDAALRMDMRVELKHLQTDLQTTMVYVTHDQTEALSMAHRIAIMNLGLVQQVGTPLEVYNNPATLFVAGFIGTPPMNFINCRLTDSTLSDQNGLFKISNPRMQKLKSQLPSPQAALIFGVRSEDVSITTSEGAGEVRGEIMVREPLGDETIYEVEVGENILSVKTVPTFVLSPGDRVGLNFDPNRIHLFEAESEKAIRS
jgi:sn-glycerol 3-phosphate transport system ATP-binding protein/multiple sugar transport system ATP-binding protein